jgi:hypothetical protein
MKRLNTILTAFILVLAMTQCKKDNDQETPSTGGDPVTITLEVNGNGTKAEVNPANGKVTFENGDQIHVASGGKYVGTLTHNGTLFSGAISNAIEGSPLQFYYLGNVNPEQTLAPGVTESCSVVISDQTASLPVISAAPSDQNYSASNFNYTAYLLNNCALVKFNVTTTASSAICITGFNNKMTVDFSSNTLTPGKEDAGIIKLGAGNGEKWAILLPQEALEVGEMGSAYSADGQFIGTRGAVPTIVNNGYLTNGIEVEVTTDAGMAGIPTGAICGKFTVNANGDQVYFSQGNLQYIGSASTPYWKFAENQWDYLGTTTGQNSSDHNVDRDLFGFGTSGWNNGNLYYQPYDTYEPEDHGDINDGYGPIDGTNEYSHSLTGAYANADWGVYNAISNGGNMPGIWRTLTFLELSYVCYSRTTPSGIRYANAVVNGISGIILLPDDWSTSVYELNVVNEFEGPYDSNTITLEDWVNMETNGAVFLPTAGERHGTRVRNVGYWGKYWTSTCDSEIATCVLFWNYPEYEDQVGPYIDGAYCCDGCSVRLVCPVE